MLTYANYLTSKVQNVKLTFTLTFNGIFSNFYNFALQILLIFYTFDKILDMCKVLKMIVISVVRFQNIM